MIQAIMTEPGKIKFQKVDIPPKGDNQIKIKIKCIGVCGSDIHVNHGKHPYTNYPVVQGHEVSAVVEEIGSNVTNVKVGDVVTVQPQIVCGECYPCTHGLYNDCESLKVMGFQSTGMASEYFVVDSKKALILPDYLTYEQGAMVEPLAVAVHAVRRYGDVKDKKVVVLGGGPIGNLVAQVAKANGASDVLLSEISEYRLKVAKQCEINTVNTKNETLGSAILNVFGKDKADVIFECVGINDTMEQAISNARKGSDIIVVGVFADYGKINMGYVQDHELRLIGTAMYREEDYIDAIKLIEAGKIELNALITNCVPFLEYESAYKLIDEMKDKVMKVIIRMD